MPRGQSKLTNKQKAMNKMNKDQHFAKARTKEKADKLVETTTPFLTKLSKVTVLPQPAVEFNKSNPNNPITLESVKMAMLEVAMLSTNTNIEGSLWEINSIFDEKTGYGFVVFDFLTVIALCCVAPLPLQDTMRNCHLSESLWRGIVGNRFECVSRAHQIAVARRAELSMTYSIQQLPNHDKIPEEYFEPTKNGGARLSMAGVQYMKACQKMHWDVAASYERQAINLDREKVVNTVVNEERVEAINMDKMELLSLDDLAKQL